VWFVGVRVISGRIRDFDGDQRIRTGLRTIMEQYRPGVRLTCQQNLYLSDIKDQERAAISALLREHGIVEASALPPVLRHAMSCPALPTCGLAITESERIMPEVVAELQAALNEVGLSEQVVHLRTTGCPNGCARPYTAEIGIVGASLNMYTIYLGASPLGTRMGTAFAQNVKRHELIDRIAPVLAYYRDARHKDEAFGDFCDRMGIEALREVTQTAAA
jgi:sulfite reductase (ferredoxin)